MTKVKVTPMQRSAMRRTLEQWKDYRPSREPTREELQKERNWPTCYLHGEYLDEEDGTCPLCQEEGLT